MTIIDTLNWPPSALAAIESKQAEIERLRTALSVARMWMPEKADNQADLDKAIAFVAAVNEQTTAGKRELTEREKQIIEAGWSGQNSE